MVRVEGDFLGCVVDAGAHRVNLRFMPRSFVYGSIVSAIGAALLAGVLIAATEMSRADSSWRSATIARRGGS